MTCVGASSFPPKSFDTLGITSAAIINIATITAIPQPQPPPEDDEDDEDEE